MQSIKCESTQKGEIINQAKKLSLKISSGEISCDELRKQEEAEEKFSLTFFKSTSYFVSTLLCALARVVFFIIDSGELGS